MKIKNCKTFSWKDFIKYILKLEHVCKILIRYIVHLFSGNQQVIALETEIKKKMEKEGLKGMVKAGGAVLAVGAIVGLGMVVASRK